MNYVRLKDINLQDYINQRVFIQFLAKDVVVKLQKDRVTQYISLNMFDTGVTVDAKLFGATQQQIDSIKSGKVYNAAVGVKAYDKSPLGFSCVIYNIEEVNISPEYFVEWATDLHEGKKILENILGEIIQTVYGKIAYNILIKYWEDFAVWTAAKGQHHNILGGLLSHTAEVVKLADDISDYYNSKYGDTFINRALLLSAAILHDIGKIKELDVDRLSGTTEYSTQSSLSTHIMDILSEVDIQAYKLGIGQQCYEINEVGEEEPVKSDEDLEYEIEAIKLLKHCLAAHHGKKEWGSPIEPSIPEAYLLHKLDEISAEMYKFNKAFNEIKSGSSISMWTSDGVKTIYKESNKV